MKKSLHNGKTFTLSAIRTEVPSNIGANYINKITTETEENSHILLWELNTPF